MILVACALATVAFALASPADSRGAESFGQIGESWGSSGTAAGKLNFEEAEAGMFGVDPVDGSVYVGDVAASKKYYRVQKFSGDGTLQGTAEIPHFIFPAEEKFLTSVHGIAIDHTASRFYVLLGCKVNEGSTECQRNTVTNFGAIKILAFNIEPEGTKLVAASEIALPGGASELYNPRAIAVDPATHELEVLAETWTKELVLQRVKPNGELGARFVDTANQLAPVVGVGSKERKPANSIAIGPDGTTYLVTGGEHNEGAQWTRAWRLPQGLSKLEEVPHFAKTAEAEGWTQGVFGREPPPLNAGPQIAISPDGKTLYWKEEGTAAETMLVRGYSLTDNSTRVVYGGGGERCVLKSEAAGLGTAGDRLVAIIYETAKVITFGSGGTGCPTPSAQFTVNGKEEEGVAVEAEVPVTFDASGSQQEGAEPRALIWDFGDGQTQTVECEWSGTACATEAAKVTATHKYLSSGTFTVSLQYKLEHPVFGNPPPVTHTVEVTGGGSGTLFTLSVAKLGTGAGTVISERGINCGIDCENEYREGKSVALSAFAQAGSKFVGWGGGCVGSGTCTVSISGPQAVTATFEALPAPPSTGGGGGAAAPAAPAPVLAPTTEVSGKHKKKGQELKRKKKKALQRCKKLRNKRKRAQCVKKANSLGARQGKASRSGS
ncbi:MAG: PKD domain-containing protein [Solirubrobacterales bacterium]